MKLAQPFPAPDLQAKHFTDTRIFLWRAGNTPILEKRSAGANENLSGGFSSIPGIAPRVAPRIVVSVLLN